MVPPKPRGGDVWVDGQWTWSVKARWRWRPGGWVAPPPDAKFSPWSTVRRADGILLFAAPAWRDGRGRVIEAPGP
jgi:hypothetical protein